MWTKTPGFKYGTCSVYFIIVKIENFKGLLMSKQNCHKYCHPKPNMLFKMLWKKII
jgi:hypothetical protein